MPFKDYQVGYTNRSYHAMLERCYRKTHKNYHKYGGAGITVCKRWKASFQSFLEDMGLRPLPDEFSNSWTLDRLDKTKGYSPSNCRWATHRMQNRDNYTEATRAKQSAKKLGVPQTAKAIASRTRAMNRPEVRRKQSIIRTVLWQDPEYRNKVLSARGLQ